MLVSVLLALSGPHIDWTLGPILHSVIAEVTFLALLMSLNESRIHGLMRPVRCRFAE